MENWKAQVIEWKEELLRTSGNDVLIHLPEDSKHVIQLADADTWSFPMSSGAQTILKHAQNYERQAGVNSLCFVNTILNWNDGSRDLRSPLFLAEANATVDRIAKMAHIDVAEDVFINPFLSKKFELLYDQSLTSFLERDVLPDNWRIEHVRFIGNFHYHRFSLLKDMDDYLVHPNAENALIGTFFNGTTVPPENEVKQSSMYLYPMDEFQQNAVNEIAAGENIVVNGPPGSGKSQLIVNALFGRAAAGQFAVLSSEKYAALAVIEQKIALSGLGDFCSIISNEAQQRKSFIEGLRATWLTLENTDVRMPMEPTYVQNKNALELKCERLNDLPVLAGAKATSSQPLSYLPDNEEWRVIQPILTKLIDVYTDAYNQPFASACLMDISSAVFSSENVLHNLRNDALVIQEKLQGLIQEFENLDESISASVVQTLNRQAIHAQILTHELFQKNRAIFDSKSSAHTEFNKQVKLFYKLTEELRHTAKSEQDKWKKNWSESEIDAALTTFTKNKWWTLSYRRWKSRFMADYRPEVFSKELANQALTTRKKINQQHERLGKVKGKLVDFGIVHPETELPIVTSLIENYRRLDQNLLNTLAAHSQEQLKKLVEQANEIAAVQRFVSFTLRDKNDKPLLPMLERIIDEQLFLFVHSKMLREVIATSPGFFRCMHEIEDWDNFADIVAWNALYRFKQFNPVLFNYTAQDFERDLMQVLEEEDKYMSFAKQTFLIQQAERFAEYHHLLSTPAARLTQQQKELKVQLRRGRSILVKEFNKKRQHKSVRELLESDAKHWIRVLKPILLLNPLSLSKILPNEQGIIDLLILDEASQIPLVHAIPILYRSKQVCIVGDPMQMAPSDYFISGAREREDVLSRGRFHFKTVHLLNHYRSQHKALIAFSNVHFYNNELQVFPGSVDTTNLGVFNYYCPDGRYIDRSNIVEAHKIAAWLNANYSKIDAEDIIAVVAFSEHQMDVLKKVCVSDLYPTCQAALDAERIVFSTVENVQGDEFDHLLISFGYGYDEEGKFAMRFGPLNQQGGEKRLNVLFSRARKSIHFFHSVSANDFNPSDNLGVDFMRRYIHQFTKTRVRDDRANNTFGFAVEERSSKKQLVIKDPFRTPNAVQKIAVFARVAKLRGWNLLFEFEKDRVG